MSQQNDGSGYHRGERAAQARIGLAEKMAPLGELILQDAMPGQHRDFYEKLPLMFVGAADDDGNLWASVLAGEPGFIQSPTSTELQIHSSFDALDPIAAAIRAGRDLGLLGIELETRRRNRLNARIESADADGLRLEVKQSFGNCPKYIQRRQHRKREDQVAVSRKDFDTFDTATQAFIRQADTLFIASQFDDGENAANRGPDVSHRGGVPGFVEITDERRLSIPDYSGNNFFNTIGNLIENPRAGLLFIDFDSGSILSMTGRAEVIWAEDEPLEIDGVERLIRFTLERGVRLDNLLPFEWQFEDYSPYSERYARSG